MSKVDNKMKTKKMRKELPC